MISERFMPGDGHLRTMIDKGFEAIFAIGLGRNIRNGLKPQAAANQRLIGRCHDRSRRQFDGVILFQFGRHAASRLRPTGRLRRP